MDQVMLIYEFLADTIARAKKRASKWQKILKGENTVLCQEAVKSMHDKAFHLFGASFISLYADKEYRNSSLEVMVDLQLIADYLDNLSDELGIFSYRSLRRLHSALLDCLTEKATGGYYDFYPHREDSGYLHNLVDSCRQKVTNWPQINLIRPFLLEQAKLYSNLQIYKHGEKRYRSKTLKIWCERKRDKKLFWWEFAASAGSTLPVFILLAETTRKDRSDVQKLMGYYSKRIAPLHILLDYFIDRQYDKKAEEINLVSYYPTEEIMQKRMIGFYNDSQKTTLSIRNGGFHKLVGKGLLALYLSDAKALIPENRSTTKKFLDQGGMAVKILQKGCFILRKKGSLDINSF